MRLLITGCGRSGTMWIARVLRADEGLRVGHEVMDADGVVSWCLAAQPGVGLPAWHEPIDYGEHRYLRCHQTRAPLDTIASCLTIPIDVYEWAFKHCEATLHSNDLHNAMRYWLHWNRLAGETTAAQWRVEDCRSEQPLVNKRNHRPVSAKECKTADPALWREIVELAQEYGYDV